MSATRRRYRRLAAVWLAVAAAFAVGAGVADANQLVTITIPDRHGEIPAKWLTYPGPPRADVLLPTGYDPQRAYPLIDEFFAAKRKYDPAEIFTNTFYQKYAS